MFHRPILADRAYDDDRAVCPDCHSAAQGSGFQGKPYCGLCAKTIHEDLSLVPVWFENGGVWA